MMVMKSCTDSTKKASSTISQASISTTMVTKLVKNEVMPISSPAFSSSGREAVNPVDATNPGRIGRRQGRGDGQEVGSEQCQRFGGDGHVTTDARGDATCLAD